MESSLEDCKARCVGNPDCAFFSFEAIDLPEDNGCTLHGSGAEFVGDQEPNTFITGPAICPGERTIILFYLKSKIIYSFHILF